MANKKATPKTGAASTINPDDVKIHWTVLVGVTLTLAAAVAVSWNGLLYVAEAQLLPETLLWLTPLMVDIPLVVLTLARGALKTRGVRANAILVGIVGLTIFSSAANFLHTVAEQGFETIPGVVGSLTNALAPWLILSLTEVLWLVATKQADIVPRFDDDSEVGELEARPIGQQPSPDAATIAAAVAAAVATQHLALSAPAQPQSEPQAGPQQTQAEPVQAEQVQESAVPAQIQPTASAEAVSVEAVPPVKSEQVGPTVDPIVPSVAPSTGQVPTGYTPQDWEFEQLRAESAESKAQF